jgi:hypothetical protein
MMAQEPNGIRGSAKPFIVLEPRNSETSTIGSLQRAAEPAPDSFDPARRPTERPGPPSKVRARWSAWHAPVVQARRFLRELGPWVSSPDVDDE